MKILITFLSYIVVIFINEALGLLTGFKAGYLIIILIAGGISAALCKAYDKKHKSSVNYTYENIKPNLKLTVIEACEENRGNNEELNELLKIYVQNGIIPKEYRDPIFEEFRNK